MLRMKDYALDRDPPIHGATATSVQYKLIVITNEHGFFSNYFKILNWLLYTRRNDPTRPVVYVQFRDHRAEIMSGIETNIWEDNFEPVMRTWTGAAIMSLRQYEVTRVVVQNVCEYPTRADGAVPAELAVLNEDGFVFMSCAMYTDPSFPEIRKLYGRAARTYIRPNASMNHHLDCKMTEFTEWRRASNKFTGRILGCHVRFPGHYSARTIDMLNIYTEILHESEHYDGIFLCSQYEPCRQYMQTHVMPTKKLFLSPTMGVDGDWTALGRRITDEFRDAYTDIHLLSQCDFVLAGSSNMLMGALCMNPDVQFRIFRELDKVNPG